MSFQSYDLRRRVRSGHGTANYATAMHDPLFWQALLKTVIWVRGRRSAVCSLHAALLLNRKFPGENCPLDKLIPWVTPGVLIGLMWRGFSMENYGVLNDLLMRLGLIHDKIPFLARRPPHFLGILTIIWQESRFRADAPGRAPGIPEELYDAANVDGANAFQRFFLITVPSLKNTIS